MPKILTTGQIRLADEFTIVHEPIPSIDLMERASSGLYTWVRENIPGKRKIFIFCGPGNNGGDGLALARLLLQDDYQLKIFLLKLTSSMSMDAAINLGRLSSLNSEIVSIEKEQDFPAIPAGTLLVDALFGSGLTRPLAGLAAGLVKYLNESGEEILAVDIPSGLFGEDNSNNIRERIIRAKNTLTFQFPKLAFFFAENYQFTGDWHVLDIGLHHGFIDKLETPWYYMTGREIKPIVKPRKKFDHKGTYGHAFLLSGSKGKTGAAILASKACLKTGCGLVTVHIPKLGYEIFQAALPEAMCSLDPNNDILTVIPELAAYNAVGIGPGIGTDSKTCLVLRDLLQRVELPMVIDADGLNILAANKQLLNLLSENTILTPHPGEADRLWGKSGNAHDRFFRQIQFSADYKVIVVLKGAFTSISMPDGRVYFNTSGNQGMATAGSGDVLTGIILSLLAQGYTPENAAKLGVFLHGLAGDLALGNESYESLTAGNIIDHIGFAFKELKD